MSTLFCPTCGQVDPEDPELKLSFTPVSAQLLPSGELDLGTDFFLDYAHLKCGTTVRIQHLLSWSEELGEYTPTSEGPLEIYTAGNNYVLESDYIEGGDEIFSGYVGSQTGVWGPTYVLLQELLELAIERSKNS